MPSKREFMFLTSINGSKRNSLKNALYADEDDDDDRGSRYYKLGKSAQNIFKDHQGHLKRELSPVHQRDLSLEKQILNQKLIDKFSESKTLHSSHQNLASTQLVGLSHL